MSRISILCEITHVKTHKGKRGTMAFVKVADETGHLKNITIYSEDWKLVQKKMRQGRLIILRMRRREAYNKDYGLWSYFLDYTHGDACLTMREALEGDDEPE